MKKYNLVNNILGWVCFVIAAVTYLLTIEPTASFWDCPEFIAQGAKLEVGHPPGNPIFMLTARFFITLFGGEMSNAAIAVNSMSALLSAATILLLFWSVTHLARRLMVKDGTVPTLWQTVIIMASGVCGALAYTWSDTFWFSAVEGEVYAFSSFCTALVFWLMLKWENRADSPDADKYLILIAYVIGVSIGVHLLNLLCIPALGLIYYYRKSKRVNAVGSLIALGISCVIVGAILYGLVPGFVSVAQWFEILCVNGLGMSYNMGVLIYCIILVGTFILALYLIYKKGIVAAKVVSLLALVLSGLPFIGHSVLAGFFFTSLMAVGLFAVKTVDRRLLSVIVLSVFVIFIGYASYALLLIRASANTPMNQNAPDNVFALSSYLSREQYGERPLFMGPTFAEAFEEEEYPEGSGVYYVAVDASGLPVMRVIDGYLRDEQGGAVNRPSTMYSKVTKTRPDQPDEYVKEIERPNYKTMPDLNMLFTRIYSSDEAHVPSYKGWSGYRISDFDNIPMSVRQQWAQMRYVPKTTVLSYLPNVQAATTVVNSMTGAPVQQKTVYKPGFDVNLRYFVNYQLNHMYWRYFMWNFAGRQNDLQGNGEPHLGNWISGIPFIDNARLGDQSLLPDEYGKGNKGHNVFYMLPLILGLIGLLGQALYRRWSAEGRGIEQFWVVFFLFFMTGIAIVLYLNQTPAQPRERDYAFAGSFYAFAIWIGLGITVIGAILNSWLSKKPKDDKEEKGSVIAAVAACVVAVLIPVQMVSQTWDDHDRSGRYTTRDFGFNYLSSLDDNAIIFTNGDNDTFPLWYAQEVEGFRTDVRVVNLSYLTTDWYATQQTLPTYDAPAIKMTATPQDWAYERLAYSFVVPYDTVPVPAEQALRQLYSSDYSHFGAHYLTNPRIYIDVDSDAALSRYGWKIPELDSLLARQPVGIFTDLSRQGSGMNQSRVLSLDMLTNSMSNNWDRPIYFATTVPTKYYLGLSPYMSASGLAYEVTPYSSPSLYTSAPQKAFSRIVSGYRWGGLDQPGAENLYLDETVRRMVSSLRSGIYSVFEDLMVNPNTPALSTSVLAAEEAGYETPESQLDMARILLDLTNKKLPASVSPYDNMMGLYMALGYLKLYYTSHNPDDLENAQQLAEAEVERYAQLVRYGAALSPYDLNNMGRSELLGMGYLAEAVSILNRVELLKAMEMEDFDPARKQECMDLLESLALEDDWIIAPMIYIHGYDTTTLLRDINSYHPSDQEYIRLAAAVRSMHDYFNVEPMEISNDIMSTYGITADQWAAMHNMN